MPSHGHDAPAAAPKPVGSIGERFQQRFAIEQLEAAFATAACSPSGPRSVGVLEVARSDGAPMEALLDDLGPELVLRIRQRLPRDARLAFAHGARFVVALPGDPLLAALLVMDRVRDALECDQWSLEGERLALLFHAGVATRRASDESLAVTLEAAERSLDQARTLAVRRHDVPNEASKGDAGRTFASSRLLPGWSKAIDPRG